MAGVPILPYKQLWTDKRLSLGTQYKDIANKYPNASQTMQQLFKVLCDTENLANSKTYIGLVKQGVGCHNQLSRRQLGGLL
jgi:hypothetical protein